MTKGVNAADEKVGKSAKLYNAEIWENDGEVHAEHDVDIQNGVYSGAQQGHVDHVIDGQLGYVDVGTDVSKEQQGHEDAKSDVKGEQQAADDQTDDRGDELGHVDVQAELLGLNGDNGEFEQKHGLIGNSKDLQDGCQMNVVHDGFYTDHDHGIDEGRELASGWFNGGDDVSIMSQKLVEEQLSLNYDSGPMSLAICEGAVPAVNNLSIMSQKLEEKQLSFNDDSGPKSLANCEDAVPAVKNGHQLDDKRKGEDDDELGKVEEENQEGNGEEQWEQYNEAMWDKVFENQVGDVVDAGPLADPDYFDDEEEMRTGFFNEWGDFPTMLQRKGDDDSLATAETGHTDGIGEEHGGVEKQNNQECDKQDGDVIREGTKQGEAEKPTIQEEKNREDGDSPDDEQEEDEEHNILVGSNQGGGGEQGDVEEQSIQVGDKQDEDGLQGEVEEQNILEGDKQDEDGLQGEVDEQNILEGAKQDKDGVQGDVEEQNILEGDKHDEDGVQGEVKEQSILEGDKQDEDGVQGKVEEEDILEGDKQDEDGLQGEVEEQNIQEKNKQDDGDERGEVDKQIIHVHDNRKDGDGDKKGEVEQQNIQKENKPGGDLRREQSQAHDSKNGNSEIEHYEPTKYRGNRSDEQELEERTNMSENMMIGDDKIEQFLAEWDKIIARDNVVTEPYFMSEETDFPTMVSTHGAADNSGSGVTDQTLLEEENTRLREEIMNLKKEQIDGLYESQSDKEQLKAKIKKLDQELREMKTMQHTTMIDMVNIQDENVQLMSENVKLRKLNAELKRDQDKLQRSYEQLSRDNKKVKNDCAQLKEKSKSCKKDKEALKDEVSALRGCNERNVARMEEDILEIKRKAKEDLEQYKKSQVTAMHVLQNENYRLKAGYRKVEEERVGVDEILAEIADLRREKEQLEEVGERSRQDAKEVEEWYTKELAQCQKRGEEFERENMRLTKFVQHMEEVYSAQLTENGRLETENEEMKKTVAESKEWGGTWKKCFEDSQEENDKLGKEIKKMSRWITGAQEREETYQTQLAECEAEKTKLQKERERMLEARKRRVKKYMADLGTSEMARKKLEGEHEALKDLYEESLQKMKKQSLLLNSKEKDSKELSQLKTKWANLVAEIANMKQRHKSDLRDKEHESKQLDKRLMEEITSLKRLDVSLLDTIAAQCGRFGAPPYQWQYLDCSTGKWLDIDDCEPVERHYCDPQNDECVVTLPDAATGQPQSGATHDFQVVGKLFFLDGNPMPTNIPGPTQTVQIRRLPTDSTVQMSASSTPATKWNWYWLDGNSEWRKYCSENDSNITSNVTNEDIEVAFLTSKDRLKFHTTEGQQYELDFTKMVQINSHYGTERHIRRRPEYRDRNTSIRAKEQGHTQRLLSSCIPPNWTVRGWEDSSVKYVKLGKTEKAKQEYRAIEGMFLETVQRRVKSIVRVQSLEVHDAYYRKKYWMDLKNKREPEERLLFHGTARKNVKPICEHGFDCRISGNSTGAVYGKGSYFAADAKMAVDYSPDGHMLVCKVLVGDYCQGHKNYVRPPPKDQNKPHEELFDSCVDDVMNPRIYSIFKSEQACPRYIIDFE